MIDDILFIGYYLFEKFVKEKLYKYIKIEYLYILYNMNVEVIIVV